MNSEQNQVKETHGLQSVKRGPEESRRKERRGSRNEENGVKEREGQQDLGNGEVLVVSNEEEADAAEQKNNQMVAHLFSFYIHFKFL